MKYSSIQDSYVDWVPTEPVFLNFSEAQETIFMESIPPAYVAWWADTTTLFLHDAYSPHRLF